MPPQNATGNWVKVTQRVPVRVRITDADPEHPLRVGATAAVTIRVRVSALAAVAAPAMSDKSNRFIITVAMMSATVMQALDTTIVNVALPHMAGNLGASMDQVSWVLTSYLIAASLVMPLTGYLSDRFGRRRFLLVSIGGFVIASGAVRAVAEPRAKWSCSGCCRGCSARR